MTPRLHRSSLRESNLRSDDATSSSIFHFESLRKDSLPGSVPAGPMTSLFFIDEQPVCFFGKSQSESLNFACIKSVREDSREGGRFNFPNPECSFGKGGLKPLQCPMVRMPEQMLLNR